MALDASFLSDHMVKPYVGSETIDISTADHTFTHKGIRNIIVTASGNVAVELADGQEIVIPIVVTASDYELLFKGVIGANILRVDKANTTATLLCGLY